MSWYKIAEYEDFRWQVENSASQNPYPFKDWFDENGRVYIPFNVDTLYNQDNNIDKYVKMELEENGYQITDYRKGYCTKGNRQFRIGKVLNQIKANKLKELQELSQQGKIYNLWSGRVQTMQRRLQGASWNFSGSADERSPGQADSGGWKRDTDRRTGRT